MAPLRTLSRGLRQGETRTVSRSESEVDRERTYLSVDQNDADPGMDSSEEEEEQNLCGANLEEDEERALCWSRQVQEEESLEDMRPRGSNLKKSGYVFAVAAIACLCGFLGYQYLLVSENKSAPTAPSETLGTETIGIFETKEFNLLVTSHVRRLMDKFGVQDDHTQDHVAAATAKVSQYIGQHISNSDAHSLKNARLGPEGWEALSSLLIALADKRVQDVGHAIIREARANLFAGPAQIGKRVVARLQGEHILGLAQELLPPKLQSILIQRWSSANATSDDIWKMMIDPTGATLAHIRKRTSTRMERHAAIPSSTSGSELAGPLRTLGAQDGDDDYVPAGDDDYVPAGDDDDDDVPAGDDDDDDVPVGDDQVDDDDEGDDDDDDNVPAKKNAPFKPTNKKSCRVGPWAKNFKLNKFCLILGITSVVSTSVSEILLHMDMFMPNFNIPPWVHWMLLGQWAGMSLADCIIGYSFWCEYTLGALGVAGVDGIVILSGLHLYPGSETTTTSSSPFLTFPATTTEFNLLR